MVSLWSYGDFNGFHRDDHSDGDFFEIPSSETLSETDDPIGIWALEDNHISSQLWYWYDSPERDFSPNSSLYLSPVTKTTFLSNINSNHRPRWRSLLVAQWHPERLLKSWDTGPALHCWPIPSPQPFRLSTTACLAPRFSSNAKAAALNLEEAQVPWTPLGPTLGFEGNSAKCVYSLKPTIWPPDFQYMENHGWNQCWNPGRLSHGKLAQQYRPARQLWPHFRPKCWSEMPALSSDLRNGLRAMGPSEIVLLSLQPRPTCLNGSTCPLYKWWTFTRILNWKFEENPNSWWLTQVNLSINTYADIISIGLSFVWNFEENPSNWWLTPCKKIHVPLSGLTSG